ncbi:uncharacterized protein NPIL_55871 [Nephila pilipes]|uniref:Retrotransposon gag domain-containing protein n=1 Tax=Nephila pilipes TaxID=299642 RepID=A0A8X6NZD3_NEPPI|nr:uncharacterized protein NPIL_55871 [Nephila pilipes]
MSTHPSNPSLPSHELLLQWRPVCPVYPNPEIGVGSSFLEYFRVFLYNFFSGKENVLEFLDSIDNQICYFEIPTNLACAYLKDHLIGRAKDWFEVIVSSYVTGTATDFAQLKQTLTNCFPVVRNGSELEAEFYSSHQVRSQAPSDFVYKLLKIQKILRFEMTEESLVNHIIMSLSPQVMDYVEVRNPTTTAELLQLVEKAEQVETEGSKGLASEESSREEQWRGRKVRSEGSIEFFNNYEIDYQSKERLPPAFTTQDDEFPTISCNTGKANPRGTSLSLTTRSEESSKEAPSLPPNEITRSGKSSSFNLRYLLCV